MRELGQYPQWVLWKTVSRAGKLTKVPVNPHNGNNASVTNRHSWASFDEAVAFLGDYKCDGLGFVFTESDPFIGIDIDKCRDHEGKLEPWAASTVKALDSYTEISPSGRGIHILVKGNDPGPRRRIQHLEIYPFKRFFTITADHLPGSPREIEDRTTELANIYELATKGTPKERQQTITASEPQLQALIGEIEQAVAAEADPPFEKFDVLCTNAPIVRDVWERKTSRGQRWSPSEWDLSLANYLLNADWGHVEITQTIIAFRRKHGNDLKLRPDYYARTLAAAHRNRDQDEALDSITTASLQELPQSERKSAVLKSFSALDGFEWTEIFKYLSEPPSWKILTNLGSIGPEPIETLLLQHKFRTAVARDIGRILPKVKDRTWDHRVQQILDISTPVDVGEEATDLGQTRAWLVVYIETNMISPEYDPDAVRKGMPFRNNRELWVVGSAFNEWIYRRFNVRLTQRKLSTLLQQAGCDNDKRSFVTEDGTWSSRGVWKLPDGLIESEGEQSEQPDDGEKQEVDDDDDRQAGP